MHNSREGLKLVRADRLVLALMLQTAVIVLFCKRFDPLLPAYAEQGLKNVATTGWLKVAMVVGALIGGLWVGRFVTKQSQLRWSYSTLVALPVVLLVWFVVATEPIAASLAAAIVSAVLLVQDSCCLASIQSSVAPSMRGRVISWRVTVNWGLDLLVALPLGWAATMAGVRPVLITCAALGGFAALALSPFWLNARRWAAAQENVDEHTLSYVRD